MMDIKEKIKNAYAKILSSPSQNCTCNSNFGLSDDYASQNGYFKNADYNLGCGLPTQHSPIEKGQTVLDLGCGVGNDVFLARYLTGPEGKVIGLDFTSEMIERANKNMQKLGYTNVEFILGDIENIPLPDNSIDVVISNCVMNLVPNKHKAYSEIYRVLKTGGYFSISDVVFSGNFDIQSLEKVYEKFGGCISGALIIEAYIELIEKSGFNDLKVYEKSKTTFSPKQLIDYLSQKEIKDFLKEGNKILNIQLFAIKN